MYKLLKKYADANPERFNKDFILSRDKQDVLAYAKDIFKSLEVLDEIKVEEVTLQTSEAEMGPIKSQHHYYKSILPSRLNSIHYKIRITPSEKIENIPILDDDAPVKKREMKTTSETFIKEGDIYINKLLDDCFYINEGIRYSLVYQIIDNATYGSGGNSVSLKSLLMPITVSRKEVVTTPEYDLMPETLNAYSVMLFRKDVNPILYTFTKDAYNYLIKLEGINDDNLIDAWENARDPSLIDRFNKFWGVDIQFSDTLGCEPGRIYFHNVSDKDSGCYLSVDEEKFKNDKMTRDMLGCLLNIYNENKKKVVYKYDDVISPWFWINLTAGYFTKNKDPRKEFEKVKTMLISLVRLIDDSTRKVLLVKDEDKKNTLTILRYIIRDFDELLKADSQNLDNKRLRLFEYQFFPLRKYFSDQIYRILNTTTHSKAVLDRMLSNLNPMKIIKETVTNELLRYYGAPNEMNLFSAFLRCSFKGPQSLNKSVNVIQRDLHPSYTGRISLIAAAAGDPGLSSNLCPFIEVTDNYYFK